ncbi:MAG TPA: FHA domain-containing protein [Alcaligenes sp.]|nr:FHA domain-containing protein [Alcaligenes sp.]HRL26089.1 FHA domain-containing protein [Alcaligenes sp.]
MNTPQAPDWHLHADAGTAIAIRAPGLVCGSWPLADLPLPAGEQSAPLQAYLRRQDDGLTIERACASGHVQVNGTELPLRQIQTLHTGDRLALGHTHYVVAIGPAAEPAQDKATPEIAADPFADLHVPGLVPVGGAVSAPADHHPFDRPSTASTPVLPSASTPWQAELGQTPEWTSTLPCSDTGYDPLADPRLR